MKGVLMSPGFESEILENKSNIASSFLTQLRNQGIETEFISLADNQCNYALNACELVKNLINNGFSANFILVSDWGPWKGNGWSKDEFPSTVLVYEAGDEPQSFFSHFPKSSKSDIVLTPSYIAMTEYRRRGINAYWFPQYAISEVYSKDVAITRPGMCITTCGDRGPTSRHLSESLPKVFLNQKVFGKEHADFLGSGDIVFQESKNKEITRRIFEGMALGRMVIADRPREEEQYSSIFTDGHDIVWYDSPDDARQKVEYYLNNHNERNRIANNGKNKVRSTHTDVQRISQLVSLIKKKQK